MKRLLRPPAGLKERGKVGARGHFGDPQLDRADPGVPAAGAVAVAVGDPLRAPFVGGGTDLRGDLGLHHRSGEHPDTFTQRVDVVLLEQLADERRDVHPGGGHRPSSSDSAVVEDGGGPLRHGDFHPGSPPRIPTTSWDANLTARDGRTFGPVNVRSHAEYPPNFLPERSKIPPRSEVSGWFTFDGARNRHGPWPPSYIDGRQT